MAGIAKCEHLLGYSISINVPISSLALSAQGEVLGVSRCPKVALSIKCMLLEAVFYIRLFV